MRNNFKEKRTRNSWLKPGKKALERGAEWIKIIIYGNYQQDYW